MIIPEQLRPLIGRPITPFIGAGLARDAGVPAASELAKLLAQAGDIDIERRDNLDLVATTLEAKHGADGAQDIVRNVVRAVPVNTTHPLRALAAACRGRVILTTNYDDAIELAAEEVGLTPRPFALTDALAHAPIGASEVGVVHLHGRAATDAPLVLPGRTTLQLAGDPAYQGLAASLLAPYPVVYFGFRMGANEFALHATLAFLAARVTGSAEQFLIVSADDAAGRREQIDALVGTGLVTLVTYKDPTHRAASDFAQLFAPRAEPLGETMTRFVDSEPTGYLVPRLFRAALDTSPRELDRMVFAADHGFAEPALRASALVDAGRALLVASPGMGKTELLAHLARDPQQPAAVIVDLKAVPANLVEAEAPELAIARSLVSGRVGRQGIPVPHLQALEDNGLLILLDSLDEVRTRRPEVTASVVAAVRRWPQHRWVVASRPVVECSSLTAAEFELFRLLPSSAWGSDYLDLRGIDSSDRAALEESGGFEDLISIPLFAAAAADRLIARNLPTRPLDLIVDLQRRAAAAEQQKEALAGSLFDWVQRLAVGLELRGRSVASIAELAEVAGSGALEAQEIRERLIRATLLSELPEVASFQRKTFQEALCAERILATGGIAGTVRQLAQAEVAGELAMRGDIDFTLDLVFENADHEQRASLRDVDPLRWARTVVSSGSEADAEKAFELIWESVREPPMWLSGQADFLIRSPRRAAAAIGRKWPRVITRRREQLIEQTGSAHASDRYNAIVWLASVGPSEDHEWLITLIGDPDKGVARGAVSAVRSWCEPKLAEELWAALEDADATGDVWSDLVIAVTELAATPEEFERIALEADRRANVLRRLIGYLLSRMSRAQVVGLLPRWPSQTDLRREVIARGFVDDGEPWSDEEVADLTRALIRRGISMSDVVALPQLREELAAHAATVLDVLAETARVHVSGNHSVFSLLWALPAETRQRADHPELAGYLAEFEGHVDDHPPTATPMSWSERIGGELDSGQIDEDHPRGETQWPHDLDERHLRRLAELSEAWWPAKPLVEVRVHSGDQQDDQAIAAVSAGAASDAPITKGRWLSLLQADELLDLIPNAYGWLAGRYDPAWEPAVIDLVARAPDGAAMSRSLAALPDPNGALLNAVIARLAQLEDSPSWANAVGLLRERGHAEQLRPLLQRELGDDQRRAVLRALAESGDTDAQAAALEDLIARARAGETFHGISWKQPVIEPRIVELLGDLILALPYVPPHSTGVRVGLEPRSAAEGMLAVAKTEAALAVYDRLIEADHSGRRYGLSRQTLLRRLAAKVVLARLPGDLAGAARLLLEDL